MSKVSAAKPGVGGGIWMAAAGSTLPTDASAALDAAFASLGYVSEDGVKRNINRDTQTVHAWGGGVVAVLNSKKTETFAFTLIEPNNVGALGLTFGEATGDLTNGITIKSAKDISTPHSFVISMLLADNVHDRIVIPSGVVTEVGEIQYYDGGAIGFPLTITAMEDSSGYTAYEYQKTVAAGT